MPKKLTLAQVAKIARAKDPETWDSLSPAERRAWADQLNEEAEEEARRQAHFKGADRFMVPVHRTVEKKRKR